ncbi:Ig-like domain-containing protein [Nonomuraea sp. NN258]|uniref:Ig-like domain-containing protein n=1 Tax=Nonomuraea antri TaxID=2730852 RepID=UPI001569953B|nr:Ig-like domain-containing protein [Nonomuraea antri]NRQ40216.1 Ig-like domain-containing protein [Nonomuraea antri]
MAVIATGAAVALGGSAQASVSTQSVKAIASMQSAPTFLYSVQQASQASARSADGQITSPSDGQVVTNGSVTVSARTGALQLSMGLYVDGPSTSRQKIAGGGANQTLSGTFDAGSAPNGTFNVTLKGEITGRIYATSTFKLRRPAEAPSGVNASMQGTDKIQVTWNKGSEPDLQSYEVSTSQSGIVGRLPADSACSGSSCKAVLAVPGKAAGQRVGFTVKAFRGDGDGGSIASASSGAAYVTLPAPAAAPTQPKKGTTKTQPTPKTTTDSKTGTKKVDPLPTLPPKQTNSTPTRKPVTTPKTVNKLPAMPNTDPKGNLPIPTADTSLDDPGKADEPGSSDGLAPEQEAETAPLKSDGVKAQSDESPLGNIGQYGMYVAGGLLLLLLAAHGGAWARRRALASAGTGSGSAVPPAGGAGAAQGQQAGNDSIPPTATAPRRPAVVLAVAKTRTPERPSHERASHERASHERPSHERPSHEPLSRERSAQERSAHELLAHDGLAHDGKSRTGADPSVTAGHHSRAADAARAIDVARTANLARAADLARAVDQARAAELASATERARAADPRSEDESSRSADRSGADDAARGVTGLPGSKGSSGHASGRRPHGTERAGAADRVRVADESAGAGRASDVPVALPLYMSVDDLREAQAARQEPVRIALPTSAVTDVSGSAAKVTPPAVRIEDRWDDYLPPSPRAMEDSGFWERPQPGSADFWAADDDEGAYAGRRPRDGES